MIDTLPDVTIQEDYRPAVIIPRLEDYFTDIDPGDRLTFLGQALGTGLDSLLIGSVNGAQLTRLTPNSRAGKISSMKTNRLHRQAKGSKKGGIADIKPLHETTAPNTRTWLTGDTTALVVYPTPEFNGTVRILITARDTAGAQVADTLLLTITPANDLPSIPVQITPADGDALNDFTVTFVWLASEDLAGDEVSCLLYQAGAGLDTMLVTQDTTLTFNG